MISTVNRYVRRSSLLKHNGHAGKHHDRLAAMMIWAFLIQMTIILTCELNLPPPYSFQSSLGMFGNAHGINDHPERNGLRKNGIIGEKNNIIGTTRSISDEARTDTSNENEEYFEYSVKNHTKAVPRIDKDFPSADSIKSLLMEEQHALVNHNEMATVDDLANFYELVYAFIAAFQRHDIPIFVGYGSHLGARRHHGESQVHFVQQLLLTSTVSQYIAATLLSGIIPFAEKDVDFEVFSVDEGQVRSIITDVLQLKESWSSIATKKNTFGFQLDEETMSDHGLKYYIDFWLFESNVGQDNHITCKGTKLNGKNKQGKTGCWLYYHNMGLHTPPVFQYDEFFPPVYQVIFFQHCIYEFDQSILPQT